MNLKQLKKMIAEEYSAYTEQVTGEPGIEVGPGDVDAMGGGDSEATLRQIFDMLKSYFEGGDGAAMPTGGADGADMGDMDAAAMGDDDIEGADMDGADMDDMDDMDDDAEDVEEGKDEDEDDKKALQERFKKLANIIKG